MAATVPVSRFVRKRGGGVGRGVEGQARCAVDGPPRHCRDRGPRHSRAVINPVIPAKAGIQFRPQTPASGRGPIDERPDRLNPCRPYT